MEKRYLTPKEVESIYGLNERTLANMRCKGRGPKYFKIGHLVRYSVEDLEKYFKGRDVKIVNG